MSNRLAQLKELVIIPPEINDFDNILRLYDIDIRTIDKLAFIQKSLQNIVFLRQLDTYAKINQACIEYLDNDFPNNQSSLSTVSSREPTPISRYPSPLPEPPPKQPTPQGSLAQLKGRPPVIRPPSSPPPILRPPLPPPDVLKAESISRPPSPPPVLKPASKLSPTAGPARLLLQKGPIRAPTPLKTSLQSRPVTPPLPTVPLPEATLKITDKYEITVNGITLYLNKEGLSEKIIQDQLRFFSPYENGIIININIKPDKYNKRSKLATLIYRAIDKSNLDINIFTPPSNNETEYLFLVPK